MEYIEDSYHHPAGMVNRLIDGLIAFECFCIQENVVLCMHFLSPLLSFKLSMQGSLLIMLKFWNIHPLLMLVVCVEFMPGGSLYEYLHKNHVVLKLSQLLSFAIDVCKGMEYLHQNNIIHRDLKAANLLMDSNNVSFSNNEVIPSLVLLQLGCMSTDPFSFGYKPIFICDSSTFFSYFLNNWFSAYSIELEVCYNWYYVIMGL